MALFSYPISKFLREFSTITIYSEVTSQCNNSCVFCPIDQLSRSGFIKENVKKRVKDLLLAFPNIKFKIFFHVLGEPLIYKDLEAYISSISNIGNVETWLATNGTLLTHDRLIDLQKAGLRNIWYSMFYTNETDYKKNAQTDNFHKAKSNLITLLKNNHLFDHIHIITFSDTMAELNEHINKKTNISIELKRRVKEWEVNLLSRFDPRKYICVSINGDVVYDWKDYDFSKPVGNVCTMTNSEILQGFKQSSVFSFLKEIPFTK